LRRRFGPAVRLGVEESSSTEGAPDMATRKHRKKMRRKARRRVTENLYPHVGRHRAWRSADADQPPLIFDRDSVTVESVSGFVKNYRSWLPKDRQILLDRFTLRDVAIKVVGVGSVGTRRYVLLFTDDDSNPLLLQINEANNSVLAPYVPKRPRVVHNGKRVVTGQHLMQPASDTFLGYSTSRERRDFDVRQLRDMKLSVTITRDEELMTRYAEFCGIALARAHANTGSAAAITGYLGNSDSFDRSLWRFALAYAEQTVRDHQAFVKAIDKDRVSAIIETL
jgi:uncharacterized protein (DUF2252 family)